MRAMSAILNISFKSISNIIDDVEQLLSGFTEEHLSLHSHDELVMDWYICKKIPNFKS